MFSVTRREENNNIRLIRTFHFHFLAKNVEGWLKIIILLLSYSHIWLHLQRDDRHFFYIYLPMITTSAKNKNSWKKTSAEDRLSSICFQEFLFVAKVTPSSDAWVVRQVTQLIFPLFSYRHDFQCVQLCRWEKNTSVQ
jgi:hypothetical protein